MNIDSRILLGLSLDVYDGRQITDLQTLQRNIINSLFFHNDCLSTVVVTKEARRNCLVLDHQKKILYMVDVILIFML